jgi:hypothetical protein
MVVKEISELALVSLFAITLVFHALVLFGVIPYSIVWGGRLKSKRDMYRFEVVSILVNTLFIIIALEQASIISFSMPHYLVKGALWLMLAIFLLNSIGNLFSKNRLEKLIFTPLTFLIVILLLIIISF